MNGKERYRILCANEPLIPIFSQAWWLDAVAGDDWGVVLVDSGELVLASLPYVSHSRYGLLRLTQPQLTQNLGPWMRPSDRNYSKNLAQEKDALQELYRRLPKHAYYQQNWHYSRKNWLPLYWMGYEQTTRYTYVINNISDIQSVFKNFEHSKRKNIRKSESIVRIVFDISAEEFYQNHKLTLAKQGQTIFYSFEIFKKIYDSAYEKRAAKTIAAYDSAGNLHGALFVVWDKFSAYNLISTIDPDFRTHGAASLLVLEIIRYVSQFVDVFDFEGSMIESVERSFRQFGAIQTPYFSISKTNSRFIRFMHCLRKLKRS